MSSRAGLKRAPDFGVPGTVNAVPVQGAVAHALDVSGPDPVGRGLEVDVVAGCDRARPARAPPVSPVAPTGRTTFRCRPRARRAVRPAPAPAVPPGSSVPRIGAESFAFAPPQGLAFDLSRGVDFTGGRLDRPNPACQHLASPVRSSRSPWWGWREDRSCRPPAQWPGPGEPPCHRQRRRSASAAAPRRCSVPRRWRRS
jgi:hypothetical protein